MTTRAALFSLCYFHAVLVERCRFGAIGFSKAYPFSMGDFSAAVEVVRNYVETSGSSSWEAVRFVVCGLLYGGHLTSDTDQQVCAAYGELLLRQGCAEGQQMFPFVSGDGVGFAAPQPTSHARYLDTIDSSHAWDSTVAPALGLNPNVDIGFMTSRAMSLLGDLIQVSVDGDVSGRQHGAGDGDGMLGVLCHDLIDEYGAVALRAPMKSDTTDVPSPFAVVLAQVARASETLRLCGCFRSSGCMRVAAPQECDAINRLAQLIVESASQLDAALNGDSQVSVKACVCV